MAQLYVVISTAGPNRDLTKGAREQAFWDEHEPFIDGLVDSGCIILGGPLVDEGGGLLVVQADSLEDARARIEADPWYHRGILTLVDIKRWEIFINKLASPD